MMSRILLVLAVAAMMTALPGTGFAQPKGSGGHFESTTSGLTISGGFGGSDKGSGGGAHISGDLNLAPGSVQTINGGTGGGGSTVSDRGGGGGGGCVTNPATDERECGKLF